MDHFYPLSMAMLVYWIIAYGSILYSIIFCNVFLYSLRLSYYGSIVAALVEMYLH